MAQQNDRHLTTEQLSALLDKQLAQSGWNAHLRACQQCQARLADLRQTVALLHALPQAELPRSFVLPSSTTLTPERPLHPVHQVATVTSIPRANESLRLTDRRRRSIFQRSLRALSTIAAVIGFILILSGFLVNVHIAGGGATFAPSTASNGGSLTANHSTVTPPGVKQSDQPTKAATQGPEKSGASTPQAARTPGETVRSGQPYGSVQNQNSPLPPALDLNRSEGREGVGLLVLVLGVLGLIVTRMIRRRAERT